MVSGILRPADVWEEGKMSVSYKAVPRGVVVHERLV
jgi:hypothetical protein